MFAVFNPEKASPEALAKFFFFAAIGICLVYLLWWKGVFDTSQKPLSDLELKSLSTCEREKANGRFAMLQRPLTREDADDFTQACKQERMNQKAAKEQQTLLQQQAKTLGLSPATALPSN
ncbi:hypothetical protein FSY45_20080 [Comamonas sp. Z1]|uniref:hypothetical protein n=1 Tax=Comamonas sp. Z1 TaxID=2601246 RepID=UPI0011E89D69|nr:hypothetical protein [Comamonas sp. Z1]TYK74140.1 hypothetical protein FSY45_20080 [Comamonas sp. Z1]